MYSLYVSLTLLTTNNYYVQINCSADTIICIVSTVLYLSKQATGFSISLMPFVSVNNAARWAHKCLTMARPDVLIDKVVWLEPCYVGEGGGVDQLWVTFTRQRGAAVSPPPPTPQPPQHHRLSDPPIIMTGGPTRFVWKVNSLISLVYAEIV